MENFIFSCNATVPVFLVMLLGYFLQRIGMLNKNFTTVANQYVFRCALPLSLFRSIAGMDFYSDFDFVFCLFCFLATVAMFFGIWGAAALLMKDKTQVGAFAQASARSSAAVLGLSFAMNIYGDTGMVPMMIFSAVPFFNVFSVLILSFSPQTVQPTASEGHSVGASVRRACIGVATNPLIIGILLGVPFALFRWQLPSMLDSAFSSVASTATPIALIVIGAGFSASEALTRWKSAVVSALVKLVVLPAVFLPLAAMLGFRDSQMVAILIMVGGPTTVSCYVMAKEMRADEVLSSNAVLISTLLSAVTITAWLYVLRYLALI